MMIDELSFIKEMEDSLNHGVSPIAFDKNKGRSTGFC